MPSITSDDELPVEGSGGGGNDPKEEKEDKTEDDSDREAEEKLSKRLFVSNAALLEQEEKEHVAIPPSKEGIKFCSHDDVLCGRGGGTNVHPGNRRFRDLINASRRALIIIF